MWYFCRTTIQAKVFPVKITYLLSCIILCMAGPVQSGYSQDNHKPDEERKNVYFISGLGADERVFARLHIESQFDVHYVTWEYPKRKESLRDYAGRLINQIDTTRPFQLVGYSFGGIISRELAKIKAPTQIILLSSQTRGVSISKFNQVLIDFMLASPLALVVLKNPGKATYSRFGARTDEEKALLKSILKETDARFLRWAIWHLTRWQESQIDVKMFQIHGSDDQLIRSDMVQADTMVTGGSHMMVYTMSEEVGTIINRALKQGEQ